MNRKEDAAGSGGPGGVGRVGVFGRRAGGLVGVGVEERGFGVGGGLDLNQNPNYQPTSLYSLFEGPVSPVLECLRPRPKSLLFHLTVPRGTLSAPVMG